MITGFHALIFSTDPAADRAFLRDKLGFLYVDEGNGWLIFKLPPSEIGVHGIEGREPFQSFAFMVDDITETVNDLMNQGVRIAAEPVDRGFGIVARIGLPSGAEVEIYEPRHALAKDL